MDLDDAAGPHLAAWRAGELDADSLRRRLAGLLDRSDVPMLVARRVAARHSSEPRMAGDLTEHLRSLLVDKMLPPSTMFDPAQAGSVRGWAWKLATTAAGYKSRELTRFYQRFLLLAEGDWPELSREPAQPSTAEDPDPDHCDDVADAVRSMRRDDREAPHVQAAALLEGLGLPSPSRLTLLEDRERVHALLLEDHTLAHRSLVAFLRSTRTGEPTPEDIDPTLVHIWDRLTAEQAGLLASCSTDRSRRHLPAHTVALAASCPLPRPSGKRIRTFLAAVSRRAGMSDDRIREAAAAFVESECEPVARRATAITDLGSVLERHQHLRRRFDQLLVKVAQLDCELGADPDEVRRTLARIAHDEGALFQPRLRSAVAAVVSPDAPRHQTARR